MHQVFDEQNFYRAFASDLQNARGLVLVHSPFLTNNRLDKLEKLLAQCVRRRVCVCVFAQSPRDPDRLEATEQLVERLKTIGVHVTLKSYVHEKLAVIDEQILWEGSLNILSQTHSSERMLRWDNRQMVFEAIVKHQLNCCESCLTANQRMRIRPESGVAHEQLQHIANTLSSRRKLLRISQTELAAMTGLDQTSISRIESGEKSVRLDSLLRLCSALNLELRPVPWYFLPSLDSM